jgi:hypothetical protein
MVPELRVVGCAACGFSRLRIALIPECGAPPHSGEATPHKGDRRKLFRAPLCRVAGRYHGGP